MLAPRRHCPGLSKVYCDITKRWLLAWNQKRTYYILYIKYNDIYKGYYFQKLNQIRYSKY